MFYWVPGTTPKSCQSGSAWARQLQQFFFRRLIRAWVKEVIFFILGFKSSTGGVKWPQWPHYMWRVMVSESSDKYFSRYLEFYIIRVWKFVEIIVFLIMAKFLCLIWINSYKLFNLSPHHVSRLWPAVLSPVRIPLNFSADSYPIPSQVRLTFSNYSF